MIKQGQVAGMRIRVFYPNPIGYKRPNPLDDISIEYNVTYLEVLDPIYHELCFIDDRGVRHRIIGLAFHVQESMEKADGIDVQI